MVMVMGMSGISQASFCLIILAIVHISGAQNSQQEFLDAHNAARASVNVGTMRWEEKVATYARDYANKRKGDCRLMHSGGPYGENIAWSSGDMSAKGAVDLWVGEKPNYNYNSNSCVGGECRHYTQVVWRNSVRLGCAKVRCTNGATFITCNYDPPGNYLNQRPY